MSTPLNRTYRELLERQGLPLGSSLENRATWRLHGAGALDRFQYKVGPYSLDYAWPDLKMGLEIDGPYHRRLSGDQARRSATIPWLWVGTGTLTTAVRGRFADGLLGRTLETTPRAKG